MSRKLIVVGGFVLVACGLSAAQPPVAKYPDVPALDAPPPQMPPPAPSRFTGIATPPKLVTPDDMTIDQLIDGVESLRVQKAEMEKREQAMLKALRHKAEKLNQRIGSLDPRTEAPAVYPPVPTANTPLTAPAPSGSAPVLPPDRSRS